MPVSGFPAAGRGAVDTATLRIEQADFDAALAAR
jgi:hypothetical protein